MITAHVFHARTSHKIIFSLFQFINFFLFFSFNTHKKKCKDTTWLVNIHWYVELYTECRSYYHPFRRNLCSGFHPIYQGTHNKDKTHTPICSEKKINVQKYKTHAHTHAIGKQMQLL